MAVEIPVIVDVFEPLKRAAADVPAASKPLENQMDALSERLSKSILKMGKAAAKGIGSGDIGDLDQKMTRYANSARLAAQHMAELGEAQGVLTAGRVNISALATEFTTLANKWNSMRLASKFDENGNIRNRAQDIIDKLSKASEKAIKFGDALNKGVGQAEEPLKLQINLLAQYEKYIAKINELRTAMKGLMAPNEQALFTGDTVRVLNALAQAQVGLNKTTNITPFVEGLSRADFELLQMREHYKALEESSRRMSTSIDGYRERLAALNAQWNRLTAEEKYMSNGKMTAEAQQIYNTYKRETEELRRQGQTLDQILQKEERLAEAKKKGLQTRRYENAILNTTAKTMMVLQEQERILSDRLARTTIGSSAYNKLKADLEGVRRELSAINGETVQTESRLGRLVKNSLRLVALHAAGTFIRNVREVTAEFELQRVALGSIIQDTERAEGLFRQIKAAAIESPFEIKDLVSYTKQLSAYQIETDKLFDTTMKLADVSAGLGVDMSRLVLAYGQVRAAAVLRGQELRQFTEAGIPLVDKLAEKFRELGREGTTTADVFQLISERAVPFRMIEEIFDDMTSAGGMFYKMQEKQAKTLAGQWANLKDAVSIMYDEIGNTDVVHNAMESMIGGARSVMQNWRAWYNVIKIVSSGLLSYVGIAKLVAVYTDAQAAASRRATAAESEREKNLKKLVTGLIGKTAAEKVSTLATKLHTAAMTKAAAASNGLSAALWRVAAAMATNPFGIAVIAVGSLIALMTTLGNKTHDVSENIDNSEASIARFNKTTGDTAKLIDQYEELSKKEKLTAQEAAKLRDISRELGNIFPKTTEGINQQTGALTLNIEKLKQYNLEAEKAIRKGMQAQISENKKLIKDNQKEIDRLTKENTRGWGRNRAAGLLSPILFPLTNAQMAENTKKLVKLQEDNEKLAKSNQELQDTLDGVKKSTGGAAKKTTEWQDKLIEFNTRMAKDGVTSLQIVSPDQIKNYSKLSDALEDIAQKYKEYAEQEKSMKKAIQGKTGAERQELQGILDRTTARKNLAKEELDYYNAFYLTEKKSGSRDRLRTLKEEITELTNAYKKFLELRKYKSEEASLSDIAVLFPQLAGWEPTYNNLVKALKDMRKKYAGDTEATRIIDQSLSNLSFDNLKKTIEDKIKQVSDDIKRSETAQNFYRNILDITGDKELATNLSIGVYGGIGDELKDRVKKQLAEAFETFDTSDYDLWDKMRIAVEKQDWNFILANLDKFGDGWDKIIKQMAQDTEKYNADIANNFANLVSKYGSTAQKIATITAKANNEIKKVTAGRDLALKAKNLTPEQIQGINERADELIRALEAQRDLDIFKAGEDYIKFFAEINVMTAEQATKVRTKLRHAYLDAFHDGAISADELHKNLRAIDAQFRKLTEDTGLLGAYLSGGFDKANEKLMEYSYSIDTLAKKMKAGRTLDSDEQNFVTQMLRQFGSSEGLKGIKSYTQLIENKGGLEAAGEAFGAMGEGMSAAAANGPGALAIVDAIFKAVHGTITGIQQIIDQLNEVRSEENKIGDWFKYVSDFDRYTYSGWEKLKSGDAIGATADAVSSWISIFNNIQRDKVKKFDDEIERQSRLLSELGYAYGRLQQAESKALGAEFIANYGSRLSNLQAQVDAYNAQAAAEQAKGKSADSEKVKQFQDSAREALDQIEDMQSEVSNKLLGTDLTSAARDFANAWIEAYKSFGSTTDALKEKFADMIQSMVVESLAARVVQEQLAPIFEMIDTLSKDDSQFSVMDAAAVANKTKETVGTLNVGLTNLMNALSGAGLNIRSMGTGLTGISKDIQGASEESILGLAAGVNTQNYYMSQINANVIRIVSILGGTGASGAASETSPAGGMSAYQTEALSYLGHLPQMQSDMAEVRRLLSEVIKVKGASSTYSVRIS